MSRRDWRCRAEGCGTTLGRVTMEGGLAVDPAVRRVSAYFDTRKSVIVCPVCGTSREFRGRAIICGGT